MANAASPSHSEGSGRVAPYRRPFAATQPPHLHPPYASSVNRAPQKTLV